MPLIPYSQNQLPKLYKSTTNKIPNISFAGGAAPKKSNNLKNQHLKQNNTIFRHPSSNDILTIFKVPGDGSCQFHALTHNTNLPSKHLRLKVVEHIKLHANRYKDYLINDTIDNYTHNMLLTSTWGDQITLAAAADVLNTHSCFLANL